MLLTETFCGNTHMVLIAEVLRMKIVLWFLLGGGLVAILGWGIGVAVDKLLRQKEV